MGNAGDALAHTAVYRICGSSMKLFRYLRNNNIIKVVGVYLYLPRATLCGCNLVLVIIRDKTTLRFYRIFVIH